MESRRLTSSVLVKPVSADCNLSCEYCFYLEKSTLYPETITHRMSDKVIAALMRQVMQDSDNVVGIAWQGGEPTLAGLAFFENAVELQKKHGRSGQTVSNAIQTNGVLLNGAWAEFLREYKFLVGLSIDGPAELHDIYRRTKNGKPSFGLVHSKIDLLREHGIPFNVEVVLNDVTVEHPETLFRFCLDNGIEFVQFIPAVEQDETCALKPFSMPAAKYGDFLCTLFDLWYESANPKISIRLFDAVLGAMLTGESSICVLRQSCDSYLVVEANGDVYPCDFFVDPAWRLGNMMEQPLWELELTAMRKSFARAKSALPEQCSGCDWVRYCFGGCPRYRIDSVPNHMCAGYRQFFEHSMERLAEIARSLRRDLKSNSASGAEGSDVGRMSVV